GWDENRWAPWRLAARNQFGFDDAMVNTSVHGGTDLGDAAWKGFDVKVIDGIVNGVAGVAGRLGDLSRRVQTGYARTYALMMLAGVVAIVGYLAYALSHVGGGL
ncbi:MAG: NADH-quinone oxidoreductase subunit, partial [Fimbriimonadaceae bacterium]|nr:NADH-quinone oxidoreductase subunit [Fimbriimonadaceae bacterium]